MIWYEEEVLRVEKEYLKMSYEPETAFYGSSSITLWSSIYADFAALKPVNLGFGGSTLAACTWFFDRLLAPVASARQIIIYAGDNDLGDGRHPAEVCLYYCQLMALIRGRFGNIPCFYISIKPSLQRWSIIEQIRDANAMIRQEIEKDACQHYIDIFPAMLKDHGHPDPTFFEEDGLHLSVKGYGLWKNIIVANLEQFADNKESQKVS